jgi:hypothetical protein
VQNPIELGLFTKLRGIGELKLKYPG